MPQLGKGRGPKWFEAKQPLIWIKSFMWFEAKQQHNYRIGRAIKPPISCNMTFLYQSAYWQWMWTLFLGNRTFMFDFKTPFKKIAFLFNRKRMNSLTRCMNSLWLAQCLVKMAAVPSHAKGEPQRHSVHVWLHAIWIHIWQITMLSMGRNQSI